MKKIGLFLVVVLLTCASGNAAEEEELLCSTEASLECHGYSQQCCDGAMAAVQACYQNTNYEAICMEQALGQFSEFVNYCWDVAYNSIEPGVCIVWPEYCYAYLYDVYNFCIVSEWIWYRNLLYNQCLSEWGNFLLAYICQQEGEYYLQSCGQ
jgi:hypothetical protein